MKQQTPRERAYNLFFHTNLTQTQIAERAGVSTRTIYDWMQKGNWRELKATSRVMPAQIVSDIYQHISHLNWAIRNRPFEERYPSKAEAETLRKLIFSIPKVKLNVSKGESAQAMINFVSWLQTRNNDAAIYISDFIDEYLHAPRHKGMEPYEFEYDADQYYNKEDFPYRNTYTFEEKWKEPTTPPLRGDSSETTDVVAEQGDVTPGNEQQPEQGTQANPFASLRGTARPDDISGQQSKAESISQSDEPPHNTSSPLERSGEAPLAPEPNRQKTRSRSEVRQQPQNPAKRPDNQPPNLKKLPDPTSGNKKSQIPTKAGQESGSDAPDPSSPDYIQKVFALWKKEIEKNKRKR